MSTERGQWSSTENDNTSEAEPCPEGEVEESRSEMSMITNDDGYAIIYSDPDSETETCLDLSCIGVNNLPSGQTNSPSVRHKKYKTNTEPTKNLDSVVYENKGNVDVTECSNVSTVKSTDGTNTSEHLVVSSIYVTSYGVNRRIGTIKIAQLEEALKDTIRGKVRLKQTKCGLIAGFTKEEDIDNILSIDLAKVFGGPVQVARLPKTPGRYRQTAVVKDIPWCVSNCEIHNALREQGLHPGKVTRMRAHVRVELFNSCDLERLLQEGVNFFNYTTFPAVLEGPHTANYGDQDVVQCFRCQGFWHTSNSCRHLPRCVRCGENHEVEYCPRPRNHATCCHCGGPHHAAYKMCPVRQQQVNSTQVAFSLSRNKQPRSPSYHTFA